MRRYARTLSATLLMAGIILAVVVVPCPRAAAAPIDVSETLVGFWQRLVSLLVPPWAAAGESTTAASDPANGSAGAGGVAGEGSGSTEGDLGPTRDPDG
jgi:hypothetical protein